MHFEDWVNDSGRVIDAVGVVVIVAGTLLGLTRFAAATLRREGDPNGRYRDTRRLIGRSILLGLELLVAGDIIRTVAATPTFRTVGVLAIIVGIRSFLSWSLELEITGRWPWQGPPVGA